MSAPSHGIGAAASVDTPIPQAAAGVDPKNTQFRAFISYRRNDSGSLAAWLRARLTHYQPPPSLLRQLSEERRAAFIERRHFYLDTAYQWANEDFWRNNIEPALASSRYLVVIASKGSFEKRPDGSDNWVEREIRTFHQLHANPRKIILTLSPTGELDQLPAELAGLSDRWNWVDFRDYLPPPWRWFSLWRMRKLEAEFLKVFASVFEVPAELIPELTREELRRRARIWISAAVGLLFTALIVGVTGVFALQQTRHSLENQSLTLANTARQLSSANDQATAAAVALEALPGAVDWLPRPYVPEAEAALYLALSQQREYAVLKGHQEAVTGGQFTPDGRRFISASRDGNVRLWDALTGTALNVVNAGAAIIALARIGRSDAEVIVAAADGSVRLVEFASGSARVLCRIQFEAAEAYFSELGEIVAFVSKNDTSSRIAIVDQQCRKTIFDQQFRSAAESLSFTRDGARVAAGFADGSVAIMNMANGSGAPSWRQHDGPIRALQFSADGRSLMAASNVSVMLWDLTSDRTPMALRRKNTSIKVASMNSGAGIVATGDWNNCIVLWDVPPGSPRTVLNGPCRRNTDYPLLMNSLAFLDATAELVSASDDRKAVIWDVIGERPSIVLAGHGDRIEKVVVSPDADRFATISSGIITDAHDVHLWTRRPALSPTVLDHEVNDSIDVLVLSADERTVASVTAGSFVHLWDIGTGRRKHRIPLNANGVRHLAYTPDGKRLVAGAPGRWWLLDVDSGGVIADRQEISAYAGSRSMTASGETLMGKKDGSLDIVSMHDGRTVRTIAGAHADAVTTAVVSPDGHRIVSASSDRSIRVWDATTGKAVARVDGLAGRINDAYWTLDGKAILAVSGRIAYLWQVGANPPVMLEHSEDIADASFSPDRRYALTRSAYEVRTWDLRKGRPLSRISNLSGDPAAHEAAITDAQFSPQGDHLVTASDDKTAKIWDSATGRHLLTLAGHGNYVRSAAFSPNGARIVTTAVSSESDLDADPQVGTSEAKVILWDAKTGKIVAEMLAQDHSSPAAVFTRNGDTLITSGWATQEITAKAYIWKVFRSTAEIVEFACSTLPRPLSPQQRQRLVGQETAMQPASMLPPEGARNGASAHRRIAPNCPPQ